MSFYVNSTEFGPGKDMRLTISNRDITNYRIGDSSQTSNLTGSSFENFNLTKTRFIKCNLTGVNFNNCTISETMFSNCTLNGTSMQSLNRILADIGNKTSVTFSNCTMSGVDFSYSNLTDSVFPMFINADGTNFTEAQLHRTQFGPGAGTMINSIFYYNPLYL